jgi:tetratricopeptide (TPR) repeat protein
MTYVNTLNQLAHTCLSGFILFFTGNRLGYLVYTWSLAKVGTIHRQVQALVLACATLTLPVGLHADELDAARRNLLLGNYSECIHQCEQGLVGETQEQDWNQILLPALMAVGKYEQALARVTNIVAKETRNLPVRWLAREVFLKNGCIPQAHEMLDYIVDAMAQRPWAYRDSPSVIAFGRAALCKGADPKRVLEKLYGTAKQMDPYLRDVYLAYGELAVDKSDFALAAQTFQEALKKIPDDPDLQYGLARAYAPSDRAQMLSLLETVLKKNPRHVPALLLVVDHAIDAEDYAQADTFLDRALAVNPWHAEAWSYRAVLANLRNQLDLELNAYRNALKFWAGNPQVDHLIGRKLSQKYRFDEGADHQRQALKFEPGFLPAKAQLAQDLLRLGDTAEGWRLAHEVHSKDAYDVAAFNLVTLHDTMVQFQTLTNRDFIVRMSAHESEIYGDRVLALLDRAKQQLATKYDLELDHPITVEIFPEYKDFGVRTFGMPDNPGYLGVCFGSVITANSPAANSGHPVNWEAVLWHEFCHVVTLHLSRQKMPRWLSEGLSVYEERQANPVWGQHLNPRYREMLLATDLTPVSRLSASFLAPRSNLHLQFAYYHSSLVVEFLIDQYGLAPMKAVLRALGDGVEMNRALEQHLAPLAKIDVDFAAHARRLARNLAPMLDWTKPAKEPDNPEDTSDILEWASQRPTNFWGLTYTANHLVEQKKWEEAKIPLQKLMELYPNQTGGDHAYRLLARVHRALHELPQERQVLSRLAELENDALDAYQRLLELAAADADWPAVALNARRFLAVNPLVATPYRYLAEANEALNDWASVQTACRTWLLLDPANPSEVHFRLGKALYQTHESTARRHVILALEETPRHREALKLLWEIERSSRLQTLTISTNSVQNP